jgi:methylmalonyl-CoA mutase cobalamin-binding domain/chain
MSPVKDLQSKLLKAIIDAEKDTANEIILARVKETNFRTTFSELLEPVLYQLGELWYAEKISLAQAYLAGKVAEDIFKEATRSEEFTSDLSQSKGNVVIGNIEDDFHSFGRKLVVIFLRLAGYTVFDLGNDIQPDEFVDKAVETNSRIIGVSAMIYNTAQNIKKLRKEIDDRNLNGKIQLCVGGAVFKLRPELAKQVGADGTTDNAIKAPELVQELLQKSLKY